MSDEQVPFPDMDFSTPSGDLIEKLKKIKKLNAKSQELRQKLQDVSDQITLLSEEAIILMDNGGVGSMKIEGKVFYRKNDVYFAVDSANQEAGFQWLQDNDLGELIKASVNAKSLSSALKEFPIEELPKDGSIKRAEVKRLVMRGK